ncbi:MAG: DinB family protein [Deltaproteobacteria bacterium]|nr:DinB family protein [Deltaproteobacteria bacterium]
MPTIERPDPSEYAEYYGTYIDKVPDGPFLEMLRQQHEETQAFLSELGEARGEYRYAAGKWSVKEVVGHMTDTERVFAYRGLCFARGDEGPLPGMDQDPYVEQAHFEDRTLADIAAEWQDLRRSDLRLFGSFRPEVWSRGGVASGCRFTVRSIAYIVLGHEIHHLGVLRDRYL